MLSQPIQKRFGFIDFTRGIIMALMAWDHVAGFWYENHFGSEGLGGGFPYMGADLVPFLARFITHFCAPTFFFLSGTSIALSTVRRLQKGVSQREVTLHLIKRAGILVLFMVFIEGNAFDLSPLYFGVLGCFAACFIIFSVLRRLPWQAIFTISAAIVLFHPLLDLSFIPRTGTGLLLHLYINEPSFNYYPFQVLYPIIPWLGVMGLGWCFGVLLNRLDGERVRKLALPIALTGVASITAFIVIRWLNGYGNLVQRQGNTIQAWLAVSKYPPDLAFLTITLGVMCLLLALGILIEDKSLYGKGVIGAILVFGRTPLFFYVTHLVLYRARPFFMMQPLFRTDLETTIVFWLIGLAILWKLCSRYE
ncbi:TPA: DUF1624 domain-containing protein, partial [Candidatus Bathyarchaeota archaeon]|nr:DUF1624 domain-containing protein [Candidatus Bathyarchaeota archaeon]